MPQIRSVQSLLQRTLDIQRVQDVYVFIVVAPGKGAGGGGGDVGAFIQFLGSVPNCPKHKSCSMLVIVSPPPPPNLHHPKSPAATARVYTAHKE